MGEVRVGATDSGTVVMSHLVFGTPAEGTPQFVGMVYLRTDMFTSSALGEWVRDQGLRGQFYAVPVGAMVDTDGNPPQA